MFAFVGSLKGMMVAGAAVAAGALAAPSMASAAPVWVPSGVHTATGALAVTWVPNGLTTTCNSVAVDVSLDPVGPGGAVDAVDAQDCFMGAPGYEGCTVEADVDTSPAWTIVADPVTRDVTLGGVVFTTTFGGGVWCPLNGGIARYAGSVTGSFDNGSGTLSFAGAPGISLLSSVPVRISGSLSLPGVTIN